MKAFMMEEQAGLTRQGVQNLRTITGGKASYDEVRKALQVLDVDEESIVKPGKTSYFNDSNDASDDDGLIDYNIDPECVFLAIEELNIGEDEAKTFLESWFTKPRRTWSQNKILKAARRKDRRHFDDPTSRAPKPANHRNLSREELKKITKCKNCGAIGHWREDCPHPIKKNDKGKQFSGFSYLGLSASSGSSGVSFITLLGLGSQREKDEVSCWTCRG